LYNPKDIAETVKNLKAFKGNLKPLKMVSALEDAAIDHLTDISKN